MMMVDPVRAGSGPSHVGGILRLAQLRKHVVLIVALLALVSLSAVLIFRPQTHSQNDVISQEQSAVDQVRALDRSHLRDVVYRGKPSFAKYSRDSTRYDIMVISDLDKKSKVGAGCKTWRALLKRGQLVRHEHSGRYSVEWTKELEFTSQYNEAGRGMELSELVHWNGGLFTFDDRTGIMYEIVGENVIPRHILMDGNGNSPKGMKVEWATVKDGLLYVGSTGKEWTSPTGEFINNNPQYIKIIGEQGQTKALSWTPVYESLREITGTKFPGYLMHEAVRWNPELRRWFFLPRRESKLPYDDAADERRGTNLLLSTNEYYGDVQMRRIGPMLPTHGFSTFQFIPWRPSELVALKSVEDGDTISTYITVLTLDGKVLMPETIIGDFKFEGLEIV